MRRKATSVLLASAFALAVPVSAALADAPPPTNGGNGAGSSGQCTGNPDDRPASCNSATDKGPDAVP